RGLGPGDFVLMIDGKVVPIASFEYRDSTLPLDTGVGEAPRPAPAVAPPRGEAHPRRFVLFFLDGISSPHGLTAARRAADTFLASGLLPTDQIALVSYVRRLELLQDFTTDRDRLRQVVQASLNDSRRVSDFMPEQDRRIDDNSPDSVCAMLRAAARSASNMSPFGGRGVSASPTAIHQAKFFLNTYAAEEGSRLRDALVALRVTVDSLTSWPGYKAIVLMGDGIPDNPALIYLDRCGVDSAPPELLSAAEFHNLRLEFKALVDDAAGAGVTVHSIETGGLVAGRAAEQRAATRRSESFRTLSFNTGGLASRSNDLLAGLKTAEAASREYYLLGYQPEGPPDGRSHSVVLRVKRSGATARYRRGFLRPLPSEVREREIRSAHMIPEFYPDLDLDLSAITGPSGRAGRDVDLVLHVPRSHLLLLPGPGGPAARLEVGFVVLDETRNETFRDSRQFRIALPPEGGGEEAAGLNLFRRVRLPPGPQTITAVLYDLQAGDVGAARVSLPAASDGAAPILGLSIYSLAEKSLWVEAGETTPAADGAERTAAFTLGPALRTSFAPGEPLSCGFRVSGHGPDAPALRLLVRSGEREISRMDVSGGEAIGTVSVPLPAGGLTAGEYLLVVQEIGAEGAIDRAGLPFRITAGEGAGGVASPQAR
ncbi:MAG TPA: VWA domain-containing protein, partial [Candidatus Polarisedimenticolia bacterium]|nr:VWA domain-containing protein [Candidatus Polarisedimenticolia bacterium]